MVVVGGGPAGCSVAEQIAQEGFKVLILEEHKKVGEPTQCAGLVSPRTMDLAGMGSNLVINKIKGAYVHAPGGETLSLKGTRTYALAIDRVAFDRELAGRAEEAGAEFLMGSKAIGFKRSNGGIILEVKRGERILTIYTKLLIGADGVNSRVAKWAGVPGPSEKIKMFAAEVELENPTPELVDIFLSNELAPGWFGWIIPLDRKRARLGLGSVDANTPIQENVKRMVEAYPERFKGMKIRKGNGGVVPIGLTKNHSSNVMLVGDAACQTKPISGGGLYMGLKGAKLCSETAVAALRQEDLTEKVLSQYQVQWNQEIRNEIETALRHRQIFLQLNDEEMNFIIRFLNIKYWQKLILKYGDIDYPSILANRLSMAPPWAEKFIVSSLRKLATLAITIPRHW